MESCKVVGAYDSLDKVLWCDHSNKSSLRVLSYGTFSMFFFLAFFKMKFGPLS